MCGICGIAASDPRAVPLDAATLGRMTGAIEHRGPDDAGHLLEPGVALGMRRLSVIDVASGRQPVASEDGAVQAVFNGEIYNYRDLRRELAAAGHALVAEGDSETIVHLYEDEGPAMVDRLRGMFAIAVWDRRRRRLVLARDRLGIKPLYVAEVPGGLAFASEVKALIAGGLVEPRLDPVGAELFLAFGFVPGPATLFAGVRKLAPATVLVWEDGAVVQEHRYWSPQPAPAAGRDRRGASRRDDERELLARLDDAVRAQMVSDVPLGVMLSGGLDSSLVTALMAQHSDTPVRTFSVGFDGDPAADELAGAREVARALGTEHRELRTSAPEHPELLDRALWQLEEPVADVSFLGFGLLCELAAREVTVALCGQGADELLGGYRKHQVARVAGALAPVPGARRAVRGASSLAAPGSTLARGLEALGSDDPARRLLAMSRVVGPGERAELLDPAFLVPDAEREIAAAARRPLERPLPTPLAETLRQDLGIGLVDNMLLYFDKMSMAASLEVRVPLLDEELVRFCAALPDGRRVRGLQRKALLRRAARDLVPPGVLRRPKRGFFHAALGSWLAANRDGLVSETLLDARARGRGQVRADGARRALQDGAPVGMPGGAGKKAAQRLFCLVLLERWQRVFVDRDSEWRVQGIAGSTAGRVPDRVVA